MVSKSPYKRKDNDMSNDMSGLMQAPRGLTAQYQESKELSEIKGKMFLARQFPRDEDIAVQRALRECSRPELAAAAQYEFPRGDSVVRGPSIRLVEVLARHWGNIAYGIREVEATEDGTVVETYAWDMETNVSDSKTFSVRNERATKRGSYKLTDPRDVYENMANNAARRKRACILAVLPGWYVEQAVAVCDETLKKSLTSGKSMEEVKEQCVNAFREYGVTPEQIAEKIGRDVAHLTENDVVRLRRLYMSIKDGFVKPQDVFGGAPSASAPVLSDAESDALDALNASLGGKKEKSDGTHKG